MWNTITNSDGYCDTYPHSNGWAQAYPDATAAADAAASPVAASRKDLTRELARQTREFLAY